MNQIQQQSLSATLDAFDEKTEALTRDYMAMQDQLSAVATELLRARRSRVDELLEKERLASRLAKLLEVLPGAVLVLDRAGIIIECNRSAVTLFGKPLTGATWSELIERVAAAGHQSHGELRLNDGRCLSLARTSLESEDAEILLLMDISETERLQQLVQRQNRLSAMGEMSARLAHQIRTPLAAAVLYLSQIQQTAIQDSDASETQHRFAMNALGRLRDLEVLVDDMLIYAGGVSDINQAVDMCELTRSVVATLEPQLNRDMTIVMSVPDQPVHIQGAQHALHSALLNVVTNALQANNKRGEVRISVSASEDAVRVLVRDQGPGIPEEFYDRIFEPFFSTRSQGTGLGLAVVHSVVSAHGGQVEVHDLADGAEFVLDFPRHEDIGDKIFYRQLQPAGEQLHV